MELHGMQHVSIINQKSYVCSLEHLSYIIIYHICSCVHAIKKKDKNLIYISPQLARCSLCASHIFLSSKLHHCKSCVILTDPHSLQSQSVHDEVITDKKQIVRLIYDSQFDLTTNLPRSENMKLFFAFSTSTAATLEV